MKTMDPNEWRKGKINFSLVTDHYNLNFGEEISSEEIDVIYNYCNRIQTVLLRPNTDLSKLSDGKPHKKMFRLGGSFSNLKAKFLAGVYTPYTQHIYFSGKNEITKVFMGVFPKLREKRTDLASFSVGSYLSDNKKFEIISPAIPLEGSYNTNLFSFLSRIPTNHERVGYDMNVTSCAFDEKPRDKIYHRELLEFLKKSLKYDEKGFIESEDNFINPLEFSVLKCYSVFNSPLFNP